MKTIAILVDTESASWMEGGRGLLEGVTLGKPQIFPHLNDEEKLALAKKILGEDLRKTAVHANSTVIGGARNSDAEFTAIQFFDVEESSAEQAATDMQVAAGVTA